MSKIVTIGLFDGVHIGHQALLRAAAEQADILGSRAAALTFEGLDRVKRVCLLNTAHDRNALIRELSGIEEVVSLPFTSQLRQMTSEKFFSDILVSQMQAVHIIIGENFTFGVDRAGSDGMAALCRAHHIGLTVLPLEKAAGLPVSSSRIREALVRGDLAPAERMLGHPHRLSGKVIRGRHVGHDIGFPTINLAYSEELVPLPHGVYVTTVRLADGTVLPGISNLGVHPTFGADEEIRLETHIPGRTIDLYDEEVVMEFHLFLRPEMTFSSPEALSEQIRRDTERATAYFKTQSL